jgi:hypothetical protein
VTTSFSCVALSTAFPGCMSTPACSCITALLPDASSDDNGDWSSSSCLDSDGGGVQVEYVSGSCQGCYGAPPARLERLKRVVAVA